MEVRVEDGDNLWKIAKRHKPKGVATADFVQQIIDSNDLDDPDELDIGQTITIPGEGPPTPRERPSAASGFGASPEQEGRGTIQGGASPEQEGRGMIVGMAPPNQEEIIQGMAPGDLREGVKSTTTQVMVDRDGEITATLGTEVPGPAGNAFDVESARREILNREELQRRAVLHSTRRIAAGLSPSNFDRRTESEVIMNPAVLPAPRPEFMAKAIELGSAPDRGSFTLGDPGGMIEEGNINLAKRPRVDNGDGTFSSIRAKSFEFDGMEVLIPTLAPDGRQMNDSEAVDAFLASGEHLGVFANLEAATAYSKRLSTGLGGPLHDPDSYIDLGSPRWREVFVEGVNEARYTNMQRKAPVNSPLRKPKKSAPLPSAAGLDQMSRTVSSAATLRGSMGPTRKNGDAY